jgi:Protein of unknown function (DUF541)
MSPSGTSPRRLVIVTIIACAALLIASAATAFGQTGSSHDSSEPAAEGPTRAGASGVTSSGTASNASGVGSVAATTTATAEGSSIASIAPPAWCCATGPVPGLTVLGQATIKDQGSAARDAAIAEAVADATDQAQAAADAAGIHLGAVLDMQVSAMAVVYPMEGTVSPDSGVAVGSTGSLGAGSEPGATGTGVVAPDRYLGSATVTITWAIG